MAKDLIQRTLEEEDSERPIQPGDICHLKGGGPSMTVREIEDELVTTEWFDKAQLRTKAFRLHSLRRGPYQRLPIININTGDGSSSGDKPPWEYLNKDENGPPNE